MALDPLTRLLTKDLMLGRLKEKVENSKRNGFPFSILLISLKDFKARNNLPDFEMDAILRSVADCFKDDIRAGVDIAARMDEQDFLIAMPGSPLKKAEEIAVRVKNEITERVKAPDSLIVEVATGVAEYSAYSTNLATTAHEVDELIRVATEKSGL
ncbi:MAG: diguanylate cyclase [Methylococcales bacterium]|nr:diguanylate cyclase [Methylococcales bacterium]